MAEIKCPSCGSPNVEQIDADKYQCPYCGKSFSYRDTVVSQQPQQTHVFEPEAIDDNPGCFMNGLCFCLPVVGFILYFVKKNEQPNCAKSYLHWALVGFGLGLAFNIIAALGS
ncbi:MAG: hypothetical protein KBT34_09115 [Prevotella sp.]|nr:hypothetical protein [Candidatus Prevotella equi]